MVHADAKDPSSPLAVHRTLIVLTLVNAISLLDRQVLALLQEPIKRELQLSDSQLGLLTGFAFSLVYVAAAIPIARLADRAVRRNVMAVALALWSTMTAITGAAQNFTQMLVARAGVGLGEAGCTPPAHSIIADLYEPGRRAAALSFFTIGTNLGMLLGFACAGALSEVLGWRMTFVILGAPGLLLALFLRFLVEEPVRSASAEKADTSLAEVLRFLSRSRTLRRVTPAVVLSALVISASMSWATPYLSRVHGMGIPAIAVWLAVGFGLGGMTFGFASGLVTDRLARRDVRWYLRMPAITSAIMVPFLLGALTADSATVAVLMLMIPCALGAAYVGGSLAVLNGIARPRMRATSSALFLFVTNVFGIGLGALLIGMVSDMLAPTLGNASIQYALLAIVPLASVGAAIFYLFGARSVASDLHGTASAGRGLMLPAESGG